VCVSLVFFISLSEWKKEIKNEMRSQKKELLYRCNKGRKALEKNISRHHKRFRFNLIFFIWMRKKKIKKRAIREREGRRGGAISNQNGLAGRWCAKSNMIWFAGLCRSLSSEKRRRREMEIKEKGRDI
jgi:hypothetical protein